MTTRFVLPKPSFLSLSSLRDALNTVLPMVLIKLIYEFEIDRIPLIIDMKSREQLDAYLIHPHSLRLVPADKHLNFPGVKENLQSYFYFFASANCLWSIALPEKIVSRWHPNEQKWEFVKHDQTRYALEWKEELEIASMRYRACTVHGITNFLILYVPYTSILECLHLDTFIWTHHRVSLAYSKEVFQLRVVTMDNDETRLFLCGCVSSKTELMITELRLPLSEDSLILSKIAGYIAHCRPLYIWHTPTTQMVHVFAMDADTDSFLSRYSLNVGSYKKNQNYSLEETGMTFSAFNADVSFMGCSANKIWIKSANEITALDSETLLDPMVWIMENSTTIALSRANLYSLLISPELAQQFL